MQFMAESKANMAKLNPTLTAAVLLCHISSRLNGVSPWLFLCKEERQTVSSVLFKHLWDKNMHCSVIFFLTPRQLRIKPSLGWKERWLTRVVKWLFDYARIRGEAIWRQLAKWPSTTKWFHVAFPQLQTQKRLCSVWVEQLWAGVEARSTEKQMHAGST